MCGRFSLTVSPNKVKKHYNTTNTFDFNKNSDIRPGSFIPVITNNSPNRISLMYWGFKYNRLARPLINIRTETLKEKTFFNKYLEDKICLIPTDGFFEWEKKEGESKKIQHMFSLKNKAIFSLAGIYSTIVDGEGKRIDTVAIITTTPNKTIAKIHNRMPAVLVKDEENKWLTDKDVSVRLSLLGPLKDGLIIDSRY